MRDPLPRNPIGVLDIHMVVNQHVLGNARRFRAALAFVIDHKRAVRGIGRMNTPQVVYAYHLCPFHQITE